MALLKILSLALSPIGFLPVLVLTCKFAAFFLFSFGVSVAALLIKTNLQV